MNVTLLSRYSDPGTLKRMFGMYGKYLEIIWTNVNVADQIKDVMSDFLFDMGNECG